MNLMLSGSLLPNTYNAKLTYYTPEFRSRADFLRAEVWEYFTSGAYGLVMVGFIFAVLLFLYDVFRKKYNNNTLYITFIFILVFIYWYMLPYAHRFGRYMMPVIPFLLLVSATGFRDFAKLLGGYFKSRNIAVGLSIFALGAVILFSIKDYNNNKENYAENCKYISDRQVAAAYWLRDNTKETDIIATHDVGAIAFYSGRKIVDVAGLVTPELITKLNDANYSIYMAEYMKNSGVTYLAFLRQWYRVANQNPVFTTADSLPPEEMDVYKFIPEKVHILPKDVNSMILYSFEMLQQKQTQKALQVLNQALSRDPKSSVTYYRIAYTYMMMNDKANFEKNILKALKIFPEYKEALIQAGFFYKNERKFTDSKSNLEKYISLYPNDKKAAEMLSEVKDSINANKK